MNFNALDRRWRRMATIASILLLTTACGGGDDPSSSAGPSSPGLRTKTTAQNPPRETMTEPITKEAVRGDVLAAALTQLAAGPVDGKPARVELLQAYDRSRPHHAPNELPYYIEHMIGPDTTGHELGRYVSDKRYYQHYYKAEKPSGQIQIQMGLSNTGPLPPATASSAPNDVLLTVGRKLILSFTIPKRAFRYGPNATPTTKTIELNAPADLVIRRHDRHTWWELIEWVSSDRSVKASLTMTRRQAPYGQPSADNEFMTCTRLTGDPYCKDCPDVEHGHDICTTWVVPEGWQAGQPLVPKDMFIQENGENFLNFGPMRYTLFWYTAGPAPFDDTVNVDMPRWRTRRPISFWGVRGDLFSTMIDSMTHRGQGIPPEVAGSLNAVERLNRKKQAEATVPQRLYFYSRTDANFYADGQPLTGPGYSPSNGPMTWDIDLYPQGSQTSPFISARINLKADVRPVFGRESLVLDRYLPGSIFWERNRPNETPLMMAVHRKSPTHPKLFAIPRDALVPFGTVRSWVGENEDKQRLVTSLELRHGPRPHQVDLCWRQWLPKGEKLVNRLNCVRWAVPRGWRHGQGLKAISAYVVDRSRHPEPAEPATRIWQSFADPAGSPTRP